MKGRISFWLITVSVMVLLYGCGNSNQSEGKREKVSKFTDLLFEDDVFVPNRDFAWNMSKEDFLSKVEGADILDPESETFDEYRYSYSGKTGITTFTPLITYEIGGISGEAEVAFAFGGEGLFRAGYVWDFNEGEEDKVKQAVAVLAEDLNANENIQENPFEIPDLSDKDAAALPYQYEWQLRDFPQGHIELEILKIKESILVQVTAGIYATLSCNAFWPSVR